jgi:hypothetical protein
MNTQTVILLNKHYEISTFKPHKTTYNRHN